MQQSKVALARELLDNVRLSLALERSWNVSSARTHGGAKTNLGSTHIRMWVGLTRIHQNRISAGRVRTRFIRV